MHVPLPDRLVLDYLDRFQQLTTSHVRELAFADAKSRTTADRVLKRLLVDGYIARVTRRRLIGGGEAGSGEHVYELGSAGYRVMGREGRYRPHALSYHALAISDVAVRLVQAERAGEILIREMVTEPECWRIVQGIELRPDLAVVLERPETGAQLSAFIEVDLATERASRITEKLTRYMEAYKRATSADWPEYPRIYFVSETEARRAEIAYLIGKLPGQEPDNQKKHFRSVLLENFPQEL